MMRGGVRVKIDVVERSEYPELLAVWEAAVRATHDFLEEDYLQELKPLILERYFDAVELRCVREVGRGIVGFCGVSDGVIQMLFVAPDRMRRGIGKALCRMAIDDLQATRVDVNEPNTSARGFYEHMGFHVAGRSPRDGLGRDYPLLHLELLPG